MLAVAMLAAGCKKEPAPADNPGSGAGDTAATENPLCVYSVADGRQVRLAMGNLQYQPSTQTWRIAPHAWDAANEDNLYASAATERWIDVFGWGASGYDGQLPYDHYASNGEYYHDGDIAGTQYDWGVHNPIVNGDRTDPAGTWRTLTMQEWDYMLNQRSASVVDGVADARYLYVTIGEYAGILVFPDNFEMPQGVVLASAASINKPEQYSYNPLLESEWDMLAAAGCAFMPASGFKVMSSGQMASYGITGAYWTASNGGTSELGNIAHQLLFFPSAVQFTPTGVQYPRSVRLAKDL